MELKKVVTYQILLLEEEFQTLHNLLLDKSNAGTINQTETTMFQKIQENI